MATTACFMIVSKNDIPIYEAEVGTSPRREEVAYQHQFVLHAALDIVQDQAWSTSAMWTYSVLSSVLFSVKLVDEIIVFVIKFHCRFLKGIDRYNDSVVWVYVTAGHTRLMLLHENRNDDAIKNFFQEVHELYLKTLLNPLYLPGTRITSSHFDTKVRALARKYL